jgi:hypothetical protein
VADLVADYLTLLPDAPAYQPPPRGLVEAMRAAEWAEQGEPASAVLAEFTAHVAPYPFGNGHPGFAAWVNSPPHPLGVLAEAPRRGHRDPIHRCTSTAGNSRARHS